MLAALPFIKTKDKEKIIKSYKLMGPSEKKNSLNDEEHVINKIILKKIKGNVSIFRPEIVPSDLFENIVFLGKKNNKRIINQQGAFIICGLYENKVDETENKLYEKTIKADDGRSMVLLVPASKKRALLEMLEDVGINEKHVYPELTYISKWASNLKEEVK